MVARLAARLIPPLGRLRHALIEQGERIAALAQRVRDLMGRLKEQERLLSLATDASSQLREHAGPQPAATPKAAAPRRSRRAHRVGPERGEVGFERPYRL